MIAHLISTLCSLAFAGLGYVTYDTETGKFVQRNPNAECLQVPTSNGTPPVPIPAGYANYVPLRYDVVGSQLCVYTEKAWKCAKVK